MIRNRRKADASSFQTGDMGLTRAGAILAIDNRFYTPSLELKCLGTSFGGQKQKFSIPRDSTWLRVIKAHYGEECTCSVKSGPGYPVQWFLGHLRKYPFFPFFAS